MSIRLPTYFVSHGGGPWPYMTGPFRQNMAVLERSLVDMRAEIGEPPRAILVVSGHWEDNGFAVSSAERPGMVYDYQGFPDYTYDIHYRAPGSPAVAQRVAELLRAGGLDAHLDAKRGFDHGTFSIMKPLYPDENVPVVQMSLDAGLDPVLHLAAGQALAPLRDEGVLIIGSGLTFHNLRELHSPGSPAASRHFDDWLQETLVGTTADARADRLANWSHAPSARIAHPRADHLMPLMTAVGAAWSEPGATTYHQNDLFVGLTASSFRFGSAPTCQL